MKWDAYPMTYTKLAKRNTTYMRPSSTAFSMIVESCPSVNTTWVARRKFSRLPMPARVHCRISPVGAGNWFRIVLTACAAGPPRVNMALMIAQDNAMRLANFRPYFTGTYVCRERSKVEERSMSETQHARDFFTISCRCAETRTYRSDTMNLIVIHIIDIHGHFSSYDSKEHHTKNSKDWTITFE